jgi:spore coat polysaccharide biosynthesis protein SpsF
MIGVLLQVRLDSSRLPNKALLELGGRSVIEHAMLSLRRVPASVRAIVTDEESSELLEPRATKCGFDTFVGPRDDVLERYVLAARAYGLTQVVRATGDNPLVSWELARLALRERALRNADYCGFDGPPLGTGVEVVEAAALERAVRETRSPYDREHVTSYVYRHPHEFSVMRLPAPAAYCLPHARVTLDTADDYRFLCTVFDALYNGTPIPARRLVRWLGSEAASAQPPGTQAAWEKNREDNEYSSGA